MADTEWEGQGETVDAELFCKRVRGAAALPAEALDALLDAVKIRHWQKDDVLLRAGDRCRDIWYIGAGAVRALLLKDGKEINLGFYFEREFVTNLRSVRAGEPSEYALVAMEKTVCYVFGKPELTDLYARYPEISLWGRDLVEALLVEQETHAAFFKIYTPEERYARIMAERPDILQRVSLSRLASYLGITRESLSRIRARGGK